MSHLLNRMVNKLFSLAGFEIRRCGSRTDQTSSSPLYELLNRIKGYGFRPGTVFDIGVANGTPNLYQAFPDSRFILIEPLEECLSFLQDITRSLSSSEFILAAATGYSGETTINVHPDLMGSSLYKEDEDSDVNGVERTVAAVNLNDVCNEKNTTGPYLIKIDAQGSELDVLKGADNILPDTELIILEASLFEFFKGGPQFHDIIFFMKERGFVVYDVFDFKHRLLDGALSQVDLAFVKEKGVFRQDHRYATREQRSLQNEALMEFFIK